MFDFSWLPIALLYPMTSLSDGCLLMATALAATLGGRPAFWGISFGFAHLFYALVGMLAVSQLNTSSEFLGDIFVIIGACILLRHTLHHQLQHRPGGACGCANHPQSASLGTIISTSFGLSMHAIASGAMAEQMGEGLSTFVLLAVVAATAIVVGAVVGVVVKIGEYEREHLTKIFDRIPGLVSGVLVVAIGWCIHHLFEHFLEFGTALNIIFVACISVAALITGWFVHERVHSRETPRLVKLSSRKA